ncbi:hypothetical protein N0V93_008689 [Gnomoniopsis smithogilvyi]|uniref:C-CAP/cofactor C-like domain-containing protein n=1 Tax=Gnomoniopsis smithogilvyi TaxID=1191159 RepID=A0A9W9CV43_9PEZI|nr:hypothetical protein N0V93_008689 [Gnomoniopsis smithogilvyi]
MPVQLCGPVAYNGGFPGLKPTMDPKEHFYRHFESQATALQDDIANLGNIAVTGGERKDATDHILSGISRLTNEVSDASEFAPPRDQMIYNEALKALREQLNIQTSRLGPKSRFNFSPTSKEAFLDSVNRKLQSSISNENESPPADEKKDNLGDLPSFPANANVAKNYNAEMADQPGPGIRKPSFSAARDIDISAHRDMHIILPTTAARATTSGSVTDLQGCVLDMSVPTLATEKAKGTRRTKSSPFASLAIKNVSRSLIVAGHVTGPAHITGVKNSVLVVNARQVRIHDCENVRVWLWCGSRPIIEGCKGVRFAEIPGIYLTDKQDASNNQWDQVDDFNWLKAEASPNWSKLSEGDDGWIKPQFWETTVRGGPLLSTNDVLREAGVQ